MAGLPDRDVTLSRPGLGAAILTTAIYISRTSKPPAHRREFLRATHRGVQPHLELR